LLLERYPLVAHPRASLIDTGIAHALLMTDRFQELREQRGALVSVDLRVKFLRPVSGAAVYCEAILMRRP
jgi:acyl-coenzyme A thioesterase PaaI-like protein